MNPLVSTIVEGATLGFIAIGLLALTLPWIDPKSRWRVLPIAFVAVLTIRYLVWRITETMPPPEETLNFVAGLAFLAIESVCIVGMLLSFVTLSRTRDRTPEVAANMGWLTAQERPPLVDVFICTYNEEQGILTRTILGAMAMDYPNFRVWVLDDGNREWLRDYAALAGCHYLARDEHAHAKAGNINNGLRHVATLDEPPDFISILDADFVPLKQFLTRALTLFREEDVGIVQTPQHFINPDPIQNNLDAVEAMPDEQRYFFDVLMPAKDAWGTAFCCGTSSVIRMRALQDIGGMPTESVTEDYLLTLRMQRNGYRTVYLNELLSFGLAPEGLKEYVTQRGRWALGFMQIVRGKDGPFRLGNGLRFRDRTSLIESLIYWTAGFAFRFACLVVPILYLVFHVRALDVDLVSGISHFLPYYIAQIAVITWLSERRVLPILTDLAQLLAAREVLRAAIIGLLLPHNRKFQVTAKGGDRSVRLVQWRMLIMFSLLLALTIGGVVITFTLDPQRSWQGSAAVALYWSWYNIAILVAAVVVCIERPRFRKNERVAVSDIAWVGSEGNWRAYPMQDLSASGMRLTGVMPAEIGSSISVCIAGQELSGRVVRALPGAFAISVEDSMAGRRAMIGLVQTAKAHRLNKPISARQVAQRMLIRVLG